MEISSDDAEMSLILPEVGTSPRFASIIGSSAFHLIKTPVELCMMRVQHRIMAKHILRASCRIGTIFPAIRAIKLDDLTPRINNCIADKTVCIASALYFGFKHNYSLSNNEACPSGGRSRVHVVHGIFHSSLSRSLAKEK
jgi:hypothetical protein